MIHSHPLTLAGASSPSQFTLTHEHERSSEPHDHEVTPDGKTATSTTFFKTLVDPETVTAPAKLRQLVDACVEPLNNLILAVKKDGLPVTPGVEKAIVEADYLINSVQTSIPVNTVIRYPAWLDVHVESRGDEHRIIKTVAMAQVGDAGAFSPNAQPYVLSCEDQDVADGALRATRISVWPDPKLEG